jgi:hypothetical protein
VTSSRTDEPLDRTQEVGGSNPPSSIASKSLQARAFAFRRSLWTTLGPSYRALVPDKSRAAPIDARAAQRRPRASPTSARERAFEPRSTQLGGPSNPPNLARLAWLADGHHGRSVNIRDRCRERLSYPAPGPGRGGGRSPSASLNPATRAARGNRAARGGGEPMQGTVAAVLPLGGSPGKRPRQKIGAGLQRLEFLDPFFFGQETEIFCLKSFGFPFWPSI